MLHNYAGGAYGKGGDIELKVEFQKKHFRRLAEVTCKDILSKKEIEDMRMGKDFWFDKDDVSKRLKRLRIIEWEK